MSKKKISKKKINSKKYEEMPKKIIINKYRNSDKYVSVILPTYNREEFLLRAVNSVFAQTHQKFELIIVDDGSTDSTSKIIDQICQEHDNVIYYPCEKNFGPSHARNVGIKLSQYDIIAFIDSDDEWMPKKLEMQLNMLTDERPIVYCEYNYIDTDGTVLGICPTKEITVEYKSGRMFSELLKQNLVGTPTVLMKKECVLDVGLFDENYHVYEDYELMLRISRKYQFEFIEEPLVNAYVTPGGVSGNIGGYFTARLMLIEKYYNVLIEHALLEKTVNDLLDKAEECGLFNEIVEKINLLIDTYGPLQDQHFLTIVATSINSNENVFRMLLDLLDLDTEYIQVIYIDLGSANYDPARFEPYIQKYNGNLHVLHQDKYIGQGSLLNKALDIADGKYITFINQFCYIYPRNLTPIIKALAKFNTDLVQCDVLKAEGNVIINGITDIHMATFYNWLEVDDAIMSIHLLTNCMYEPSILGKFFKVELIKEHNIRFSEYTTNYETLFTESYFAYIKSYQGIIVPYITSENDVLFSELVHPMPAPNGKFDTMNFDLDLKEKFILCLESAKMIQYLDLPEEKLDFYIELMDLPDSFEDYKKRPRYETEDKGETYPVIMDASVREKIQAQRSNLTYLHPKYFRYNRYVDPIDDAVVALRLYYLRKNSYLAKNPQFDFALTKDFIEHFFWIPLLRIPIEHGPEVLDPFTYETMRKIVITELQDKDRSNIAYDKCRLFTKALEFANRGGFYNKPEEFKDFLKEIHKYIASLIEY